jgi:hypothetical protein
MPSYSLPLPERFRHHRNAVNIVAGAGVEPPKAWREIDANLDAYLAIQNNAAERLAELVVRPVKGADMPTLKALALAGQLESPGAVAAVNNIVVTAVEAAMLDAYADVAAENYAAVGGKFDAAAQAFTEAASMAPPEAAANAMITSDDATRTAWLAAEVHAAALDRLLPAVLAAAQLCGVRIDSGDDALAEMWWQSPLDEAAALALAVDTRELHRRRCWEAWLTGGPTDGGPSRTGRWGALVAIGATIRALPNLDDYAPYRRPRPLVHQQEQIPGQPRGTVRMKTIDPEDTNTPLAPIDPQRDDDPRLVSW